jgi:hypothetical protein
MAFPFNRLGPFPPPLTPHNRRVALPSGSPHRHCEPLVLLLLGQRGDAGGQCAKGGPAIHGLESGLVCA